MTFQLNHGIMINMFIGNYSGIRKFWFGILIILIHRFTPFTQGKMENQEKDNNSVTYSLACEHYVQSIVARHII